MSSKPMQRAQYIDLLWQLKHLLEQNKDHSIRFIHFNRMLKDESYRNDIIQVAQESTNEALVSLANQLAGQAVQGVLTQSASAQAQAAFVSREPVELNKRAEKKPVPWYLIAAPAVAVVGAAFLSTGFFDHQVSVSGNISGDRVWQSSKTYTLKDIVYVLPGASLTIEPGTRIVGTSGSALVITDGGKLMASGTAEEPIVFTSANKDGERKAGDWGGVVMLGDAPVNGGQLFIEGLPEDQQTSQFGGTDLQHNCGVLQYARIEFAGFEIGKGNELNGLTLGGCGEQTLIDHIQIHRGLDDGLEIFGGTVSVSYILVTGAGDDSFDWDKGWQGSAQFLIAQQYENIGDHGFEIDSNNDQPNSQPRTLPKVSNVTLISDMSKDKFNRAMSIDSGAGGDYRNILITGFSGESIDLTTESTVSLLGSRQLSFNGVVMHNVGSNGSAYFQLEDGERNDDGGFNESRYFSSLVNNVEIGVNPYLLGNATSETTPKYHPSFRSPVNLYGVQPPQGDFWQQAAKYVGAVKPGDDDAWYLHWTAFPLN